jgi:hypothetical protein
LIGALGLSLSDGEQCCGAESGQRGGGGFRDGGGGSRRSAWSVVALPDEEVGSVGIAIVVGVADGGLAEGALPEA